MDEQQDLESISADQRRRIIYTTTIIPIARMIASGELDPTSVTREHFWRLLLSMGENQTNPFEFYPEQIRDEISLVQHCLESAAPRHAIVVLFTLLEAEINTIIRLHLTIRGFSESAILAGLKGTDIGAKINLLLPLLAVPVTDRFRNAVLQARSIRNVATHNKAAPYLMDMSKQRMSQSEAADERARQFFEENPLDRIERDVEDFSEHALRAMPALESAIELFAEHYDA